jgi:hypothetical protein
MTTLLLLAALLAQDALEPAKHPWLAWKPGASARYRVVVELGATRQEGAVQYTLAATGADGFAVKVVASQFNREVATEQKDSAPARGAAETLTVAGKEVAATAWATRGTRGGLASETRFWIRADGGAPVKMSSRIDGQEDITLAAAALEDVVKTPARELTCVRLEGRDAAKNHQVTAWFSSDVPGGLVRMVTKAKVQGQELTSTLELVEIAATK